MIKMFIDNEEVVCNKEFTIKEEMLSTSSTILNNCYPKSWEETHDYVSNFYYPKDYSKCLIYENNDINFEILGETMQSGIPSPSFSVPIENLTGTIKQTINNKIYTFDLNNIELCKIDNFQDKIYKNNSIWNLKKEINLVSLENPIIWVIDGNSASENNISSNGAFTIPIAPNNIQNVSNNTMLTNNFMYEYNSDIKNNSSANNMANNTFCIRQGTNDRIYFRSDDFIGKNASEIKEILGVINIYYVSNVSNVNEITDNVLLNQLNQVGNELLFAGMVKNSGDISLNPRYPKYCSLEILDFKDFLSTGDMLDFVISNKTITEAINMVVDTVSQYGFVLGNIEILNPDEVIGAYSTQNKTAYDVLQYLADISESRWTTRMIDENTIAIDFYDPTLMPSGIDIDYTNEWWCNNKVIDLSFNYGTRDYRNKQVMLSDEVYGGVDYDETILADGYNTNFVTTTNIAKIKAISVDGSQVTVATTMDKEIGIEAAFYYTPGENTIEASQIYSSGSQIVVGYTPLVKGREVILNSAEISRINANTGRKGVIARYETRNDVLSSDELKMIGETYIKYKGSPEIILTLVTQMDIYNVGQSVYFNSPINELLTDYMVKKKSTEIIATTGDIFYTYELTSSFNSETAINWFDNQRNKVNGNISEGQSVVRNIDIEETANIIWDTLTITEVTVTGDNVLNSSLNSPFIQ